MTNLEEQLRNEGFIEVPNTRMARWVIYARNRERVLAYQEENGELKENCRYYINKDFEYSREKYEKENKNGKR